MVENYYIINYYVTGDDFTGRQATVIGWGYYDLRKKLHRYLWKADATVLEKAQCKLFPFGPIGDDTLCAYGRYGGICQVLENLT